jgi:hypothetical protein
MKNLKNIFFAIVAVLFGACLVWAAPEVKTVADAQSMYIGDNLKLTVTAVLDDGYFIIKPESGVENGSWCVKNVDVRQKPEKPNTFVIEYTLTAYTIAESLPLPVFEVFYSNAGGQTGSFYTADDLTVKIDTLLSDADNYEEIKDIKPLEPAVMPKWIVIFFGLSILFFVFVTGSVVLKQFKKLFKRKVKPSDPFVEAEKAFNTFLVNIAGTDSQDALFNIIDSRPLSAKECQTFYYELSEILRNYIDAKYKTNLSSKSGNFLYEGMKDIIETKLTVADNIGETVQNLYSFLKMAENVKYAGSTAGGAQLKNDFNLVKTLVEKL